ncbi:Tyrosine-protein kinase transmembrane receptor Ror [Holothuria leucospilota]|uniref:Tyrosine-protein kinase transmembrane receptor Ror n=1 Tax=Holothuria leucospilota TaxID=206669 RepID=A0A9Q1CQM0_HOLLE|nr:Tyrosine-protein kinase transmembrane receptor Ror [Holothuria leucospilota]
MELWWLRGKLSPSLVITLILTIGGQCRVDGMGNATNYRTCIEKESIKLQCTGKATYEKSWKFNGVLLFRNKMLVNSKSSGLYSINSKDELLINNMSVVQEGHYQCENDYTFEVAYYVTVEVLPFVSLTVNNETSSDTFVIENGTTIRSTCYAEGSRPAVDLSWLINSERVDPRLVVLKETSKNDDNGTFNSITTVQFRPKFVQGTLTCVVHSLSRNFFHNVSIYIMVFPSVQLFIQGQSEENDISISEGEDVQCVCITKGSRPSVNITWMVNDDVVSHSSTQVNETSLGSGINKTFDKTSSFILQTGVKAGNITCIVHSLGKRQRYHASFHVKDKSSGRYFYFSIPGFCILFLLLGLIIKKIQDMFRNRRLNMEAESDRRDETPYQFVNTNGSNLSSPPYSKCRARSYASRGKDKISVKNITWLTKLSGEGQMIYWKAKSNSGSTTDVSYIVARSLSETADTSEWRTFRDLARWLASLKKHKNIVITLGIEIAEVPYFIYQTYVGNETLRKFLVKKYKIQSCYHNREDEESVCRMLIKFVCEIADGMLFLTKEKYRHPGLSAQKVLLDQSGRCILYDIWPATLSVQRVRQIMKKPKPPVAWLPPETSQLLQYSHKSDVWSFGTVTWEIYSLGDSPVHRPSVEETGYVVKQNEVLARPDLCPERLYKLLVSTWHASPESRPSFEEIQYVLKCQNTDFVVDENYDAYEDTSSFYYE